MAGTWHSSQAHPSHPPDPCVSKPRLQGCRQCSQNTAQHRHQPTPRPPSHKVPSTGNKGGPRPCNLSLLNQQQWPLGTDWPPDPTPRPADFLPDSKLAAVSRVQLRPAWAARVTKAPSELSIFTVTVKAEEPVISLLNTLPRRQSATIN